MAIKDSREVVIEASPEAILEVIADVEASPKWASQYQSAEILNTDDNGRPRQVKMVIKIAGVTSEQVIEYTWAADGVSWTLVSAGQIKAQDAKYTLTPQGDSTNVRFDMDVNLSIPLPEFLVKRTMRGGMEAHTDGLREYMLNAKKG